MSTSHETASAPVLVGRRSGVTTRRRWGRTLLASTAALSLGIQNAAWAVCADGSTFPPAGYVVGGAHVADWSPNTFTGTLGSLWVPDNSVNEHNDPAQPLTGGGHNWAFDQGATLCKMADLGTSTTGTTGWSIPPTTSTVDCIGLPVIKGGKIVSLGDVPGQGDVITPTCDPTKLSTAAAANPANTALNQLGCSISHGVATTPATATSYMFLAGAKGGLFSVPLSNVATPVKGSSAGKVPTSINYYSAIPEGQKLTNATVSPDGKFAIATTDKRATAVFTCLNPLGDPGDPTTPINPAFKVPAAGTVACMSVGSNGLTADLTTEFGPDGQPYFGGQRDVTSFDSTPGGTAATAWPQCITHGTTFTTAQAFAAKSGGHCGTAQANSGFFSVIQPSMLIRHGQYMYAGPQFGGSVIQYKVTVNPISGLSTYKFRNYMNGLAVTSGLGVAEDLNSLMVYRDPSAVGTAAAEVVTKLPLCEDM